MSSDFATVLRTILEDQGVEYRTPSINPTQPVTPPVPTPKPTIGAILNTPSARKDLEDLFRSLAPIIQPKEEVIVPKPETTIASVLNLPQKNTNVIDTLYTALNHAEMKGLDNHWIRTMDKPKGKISTAYGPLQITTTLVQDYLDRKSDLFSPEEQEYMKRFIKQGKKFAAFDKGKLKDKRFGYGGQGELTSQRDKILYESMAKKLIADKNEKLDSDYENFWVDWRGDSKDKAYRKRFYEGLGLKSL